MNGRLNPAHPISGLENHTVSDYWSWAYSDILTNTNRSIFAEYLVGAALGVLDSPRSNGTAMISYTGRWELR